MLLNDFVSDLKYQLQFPLPGEVAQLKMAPSSRKSSEYYLQQSNHPKKSSVLILLYEKSNVIHTLLTLRPSYSGVHSSQVSFPGGKIEEGESIVQAAFREANEEVGIAEAQLEEIGQLSSLYIPASNYVVNPVIARINKAHTFVRNEREVEQLLEVSLNDLLDVNKMSTKHLETSYAGSVEAPYYDFEGHHVWGATAMIISEFNTLINRFFHR